MATRVVSAAGGNWNSTATWVGGVIPTTSDDVVANGTSGPLTVNVTATVQFLTFTGYTSTLTINSGITLATASTGTSTFDSTYTYNFLGTGGTQGRIAKGAGAQTYTQTGTLPIPHFGTTSTTGILTLATDLYVENYIPSSGIIVDGNQMRISGNISTGFGALQGTTIFRFVGNGTISILASATTAPCNIIIDTPGTYTISSQGLGLGNGSTNATALVSFQHLQGTIINPTLRPNLNFAGITLDLIPGTTWDWYAIATHNSTTTFVNPTAFDKFIFTVANYSSTPRQIAIDGNDVTVNDFSLNAGFANSVGIYYQIGVDFIIDSAITMTVNNSFDSNGGNDDPNPVQTPNFEIRSAQPGTQVNLTVNTYDQYVSRTRFTDINCSGGNTLYGQNITLANTTNITQYTLPPSGGGSSESAYTYFS